ncbi:MAG TPA: tRNA (adenosine(37)-N6)-threonylcarbamoyltransferase complex ATPase subunit type 1 TsaE, partial [Thermodesulfovibrionales bacterium]|nr:tRNA (adenosine(37)-N6)-threonylcarbamoyltransferase complex ATPase subunit type 1 TsaE [Thermodesulfovibrionales bacterium]
MYEEFYGLKARPFSKTPDPKFLFMSRTHEEALARLQYAVEEREIVVLTGEVGCGKTTLTRALMDALDEKYRVVLILNPRLTSFDFLKTLCGRLQCNAASGLKSDLLETLYARLYEDHMSGVTPVVIIDE